MKLVRSSHRMYDTENKEKQKKQTEGQKRIIEKRKATIELNQVIAAKKALVADMKTKMNEKIAQFDADIVSLQEKVAKK